MLSVELMERFDVKWLLPHPSSQESYLRKGADGTKQANATSQICSWCWNFSSAHFWREVWDEILRASGRRRDNRMGHGFILFPELSSSCWIPVVCYTSLDSQREHCILSCWTSEEGWIPHPWSTCYKWVKEGKTRMFPPALLCQHLSFRAGSLWKVLEHA